MSPLSLALDETKSAVQLVPTDQRYTPSWVLDIAITAFGPIMYDPATIPSNPTGAVDFSALPEDGLAQQWATRAKHGLIWCNPPFSRGQLRKWTQKAVDQCEAWACHIVMLTPVDSTTDWYDILTESARVAAPLRRRVKYVTPPDQPAMDSAAKGAAMLWYLGRKPGAFIDAAREHAHCFLPGALR